MKISEIITDKYKLRIPPTVYYDLLADVQEAEEDQEPRWIPVTERLPKENGKYFVMYRERQEKIICVGTDYFMRNDEGLDCWSFDVIKWMPRPEYKENTDENNT